MSLGFIAFSYVCVLVCVCASLEDKIRYISKTNLTHGVTVGVCASACGERILLKLKGRNICAYHIVCLWLCVRVCVCAYQGHRRCWHSPLSFLLWSLLQWSASVPQNHTCALSKKPSNDNWPIYTCQSTSATSKPHQCSFEVSECDFL